MKQEENIRELAIQYFEGRISRADEKNLFEYIEQVEGGYGRFRQWEREWMNHRNTDSETDAEWEALKHKMYTQEAIVPLLKKSKPGIWKIARIAVWQETLNREKNKMPSIFFVFCIRIIVFID